MVGNLSPPGGLVAVATTITAERVALLFRHTRVASIATLFNATLLAGVHVSTAAALPLALWWTSLVVLVAVRLGVHRRYRQLTPIVAVETAARWGWRYTALIVSTGLVWGGVAVVLMPTQTVEQRALTLFLLAGMIAAGVPYLTAWRPAAIGYVAVITIPVAAAFAVEATLISTVFAAMLVMFSIAMITTISIAHRALMRQLALQHSHQALLTEAFVDQHARHAVSQPEPRVPEQTSHLGITPSGAWVDHPSAALAVELRLAIDAEALSLVYQPIIDLRSGGVAGVEALVRWPHPTLGELSPDQFLPLAEQHGLIAPLGAWVLAQACRQQKCWQQDNCAPHSMSVNLAASQCAQADLAQAVVRALDDAALAPDALILELTETTLIKPLRPLSDQLQALRALGVRVAIDDFGTGYSSLNYLQSLPLDLLKLDRSFIAGVGSDPRSVTIVDAVVQLAQNLDLTVIVEGIETTEQWAFALERNVALAQGYFLASPMSTDEATTWLRQRTATTPNLPGLAYAAATATKTAARP